MQELEEIVKKLSQEGIEYAVCGGMALPKGLISLKLLRDNLQDKADIEYLSQLIKKSVD